MTSIIRTLVLAAAACLLAGCAYHRTTQTGCEESTQTYPEMEGCLKGRIANAYTASERDSPDLRLYFIKADRISERVRKDLISDFDGRVELQALYVDLRIRTAVQ